MTAKESAICTGMGCAAGTVAAVAHADLLGVVLSAVVTAIATWIVRRVGG